MRRRLFTFAAAVSLVLCVATVVLWVRSYRRIDYIVLAQYREGFLLLVSHNGFVNPQPVHWIIPERRMMAVTYRPGGFNVPLFYIPHLLIALSCAVMPSIWLAGRYSKGRHKGATYCSVCQFNLTGNTSGVCPECGEAIPPTALIGSVSHGT